jgi:hypothetical protein
VLGKREGARVLKAYRVGGETGGRPGRYSRAPERATYKGALAETLMTPCVFVGASIGLVGGAVVSPLYSRGSRCAGSGGAARR